jgi:hypothetical protein
MRDPYNIKLEVKFTWSYNPISDLMRIVNESNRKQAERDRLSKERNGGLAETEAIIAKNKALREKLKKLIGYKDE